MSLRILHRSLYLFHTYPCLLVSILLLLFPDLPKRILLSFPFPFSPLFLTPFTLFPPFLFSIYPFPQYINAKYKYFININKFKYYIKNYNIIVRRTRKQRISNDCHETICVNSVNAQTATLLETASANSSGRLKKHNNLNYFTCGNLT